MRQRRRRLSWRRKLRRRRQLTQLRPIGPSAHSRRYRAEPLYTAPIIQRKLLCMSGGQAVAVGVLPAIVVVITLVVTLSRRKQVRPKNPLDQYRYDIAQLRRRPGSRRARSGDAVASGWAALFVPFNFLHLSDPHDSGDGGGDYGGGDYGGGDYGGAE
jgi:hypothetical protein